MKEVINLIFSILGIIGVCLLPVGVITGIVLVVKSSEIKDLDEVSLQKKKKLKKFAVMSFLSGLILLVAVFVLTFVINFILTKMGVK